jgi:hypothetical protein
MLSEKCYSAWEKRVAQSLLSRVCFMTPEEMCPLASQCIDLILHRFPNLPSRYKQNYAMTRDSAREPMLSVILFTMHLLPEESPIRPTPPVQARLKEHVTSKMVGVYTTLQEFTDAVTISSISDPV